MKQILHYSLKYWYLYTIAIISMIISISLDMLSPIITKSIVDNVLVGGNIDLLPKLLAGIIAIGLGRCLQKSFLSMKKGERLSNFDGILPFISIKSYCLINPFR